MEIKRKRRVSAKVSKARQAVQNQHHFPNKHVHALQQTRRTEHCEASPYLSLHSVLVNQHVLQAGEAVVDTLPPLLLHNRLPDLPDLAHRLGWLRLSALHVS